MSNSEKKVPADQSSASPIFQESIINSFCSGLSETVETMGGAKITFGKASIEFNWKTEGDISGIVDFETEKFKGSLYIHFPSEVLIKIYNHMVGEEQTEMSPEVMDCIGEISNMAYGVAKQKLDPLQLKFSMSIPKVSKTTELSRLVQSPHLLIPFYLYEKQCQLEVLLMQK